MIKKYFLFFAILSISQISWPNEISTDEGLTVEKVTQFTLKNPVVYQWEKEKPSFKEGSLVTVSGSPEVIVPRQSLENIIYVDGRIAERITAIDDHTLVLLVPQRISLNRSKIWVGEPGLPENIDKAKRKKDSATAKAHNIRMSSFTASNVEQNSTMTFASEEELYDYSRANH